MTETGPIKERVTRIKDRSTIKGVRNVIENDRLKEMKEIVEKKNNREVSSSVQIIDIDRQKSLIETGISIETISL